jgi:hypothetical protein
MSNEGDAIRGIQNMDPIVRDALARIVDADQFNGKALADDVLLDAKSKGPQANQMTTDEKFRGEHGVGRFIAVDVHNNVDEFLKNPALEKDLATILKMKPEELDKLLKAEKSHEDVTNHQTIAAAAQQTIDASITPLATPEMHQPDASKRR